MDFTYDKILRLQQRKEVHHTPLDYYRRTFLGEEGKSPKGTKIKVSHVGDTLDGKRDAHAEVVALSTYFSSRWI